MRRTALVLVASAVLVTSAAACSSGGGGGTSSGSGSGTLDVIAGVTAVAGTNSIANCPVQLIVNVSTVSGGNPVNDAVVKLGPHGAPLTLTSAGNGGYTAFLNTGGLAALYDLSVVRGSDSLTGVVMAAPDDFRISISPDPPVHGQGAALGWTPIGEAGIYSYVQVLEMTSPFGLTYQDTGTPQGDTGRTLPATAFPNAGEYQIQVSRATLLRFTGTGPGSGGVVQIGRAKFENVP